jgi:hypothetical protein
MQDEQIVEFIRRAPFIPFDIRTSDGRVYTVDHPEFIARSRDGRTVTFYTPEDSRLVVIDTAQIVALELANRPSAA